MPSYNVIGILLDVQMNVSGIFAPVSKVSRPGILVHNRSPMTVNTPRNISHKKVDTSHVSAKVDTGRV